MADGDLHALHDAKHVDQFRTLLLDSGYESLGHDAPPLYPSGKAGKKAGKAADVPQNRLGVLQGIVTDPGGKTRLIIVNSERFPDVELRGKVSPRSIHDTAGLVSFDAKGEETGGLGLAKLRDEDVANLTFDYRYQTTDGIRIIKQESADGTHWQAGFNIFDRRPYKPGPIESSQGVQRIALADENQNAQLVISDTEGHPRIRIGVDKTGKPRIEMLNPDGKVTYRAADAAGRRLLLAESTTALQGVRQKYGKVPPERVGDSRDLGSARPSPSVQEHRSMSACSLSWRTIALRRQGPQADHSDRSANRPRVRSGSRSAFDRLYGTRKSPVGQS